MKVLSAVGMRQAMVALAPTFERETGHKLAITFDSGAVIARRMQDGEAADIVIIPRAAIDDLVRAGAVAATSVIDVASSTVGGSRSQSDTEARYFLARGGQADVAGSEIDRPA